MLQQEDIHRLTLLLFFLLCAGCLEAAYHGKLVGSLRTNVHEVVGTVYAVDERRLRIVGFSYDGKAPDALFYVGTRGNTPSGRGHIVPDENGRTTPLRRYANKTITITLPGRLRVNNIRWFSVWCREYGVDFGNLIFPKSLDVPAPRPIGSFSGRRPGLQSGVVTALDTKTILVSNLRYDGRSEDAIFWVGSGPTPTLLGRQVPAEDGSMEKLKPYNDVDITLKLPAEITIHDINWLSIWNKKSGSDLGHITIPADLNVPPYLEVTQHRELENCESVHKRLNVAWQHNDTHITIELAGRIGENDYMSFGLSGSDQRTTMIQADVVVAYFEVQNGRPVAVDYSLTAYGPCNRRKGACPDVLSNGNNDVQIISGSRVNGVTTVKYMRRLTTADISGDRSIPTDRKVYTVWALGNLDRRKLVRKHYLTNTDLSGQVKIDPPKTIVPWSPSYINGRTTKIFRAQMGPTGGDKGFSGITGRVSWGVAWYINKMLIPEITVKRGENYTFIIEGGNNFRNSATYHPLYITSDPTGGYAQKTNIERRSVKYTAGLDANGQPLAGNVGRLCQWVQTGNKDPSEFTTFAAFSMTLKLRCAAGRAGVFTWIPDKNTPNLVYYQCHTHKNLGWKIHVVDEYKEMPIPKTHPTPSMPDSPSAEPEAEPKPRNATDNLNSLGPQLKTKNKTKTGSTIQADAKSTKSGADGLFYTHKILLMLLMSKLFVV